MALLVVVAKRAVPFSGPPVSYYAIARSSASSPPNAVAIATSKL